MDELRYLYTPFIAKRQGTDRLIAGPVSAAVVDIDGQLADPVWLKSALPEWMVFGNIREQHNPFRNVGVAQSLDLTNAVGPSIVANIVDDECWNKIEAKVFKGFSLGVRNARVVMDGRAPKGTIVGGDVIEVSVVDHPAVRKAAFSLVTKAAGGWKDQQSGITYEALNKGLTDDPEAVKAHIITLAKEKGYTLPTSWEESTEKMSATDLTKAAKKEEGHEITDNDEGDKPEDGKEKGGDNDYDWDDDDDYSCPKCGKDARKCHCYDEMNKAADDFQHHQGDTRPIKAGHPVPKGTAEAMHAYDGQHEGPEGQHAPSTSSDAKVRLDYTISKAEHLVNRMEAALDNFNTAAFNPNNPAHTTRDHPTGEEFGATPSDLQSWHGGLATSEKLTTKFVVADDVYKIAADVCTVALDRLFADNGIITKGAGQPVDTTKAALVDLVKSLAADVAYEAFDQLEKRVAKVESTPLPSKGYAVTPSQSPASQYPPALSPFGQQPATYDVQKFVTSLSDDEQRNAAAQFFRQDWGRPLPTPR